MLGLLELRASPPWGCGCPSHGNMPASELKFRSCALPEQCTNGFQANALLRKQRTHEKSLCCPLPCWLSRMELGPCEDFPSPAARAPPWSQQCALAWPHPPSASPSISPLPHPLVLRATREGGAG